MNFDLFVDEFEILRVKLGSLLNIAVAIAIGQNAGTLSSDRFVGLTVGFSGMVNSY